MRCFDIHLKEVFPFLGEQNADPVLTAYLPYNMTEMSRENDRRPCVLICPGGGYRFVSQREAEPIALHFLPEGYNVFVLTYSVDTYQFPTQLRQVAAAMEMIHMHAEQWNCDPNRVAIAGFSAGGHLAAHYSNTYNIPEVREVFPDSKPVQASILSYPVITADRAYCHPGSFEHLLGHSYPMSEAELEKFSCHRLVSENTPPAFVWHTTDDAVVPVQNSLFYTQALAKFGIPFELHIYPKGFHGLVTVDDATNGELDAVTKRAYQWLENMKAWLKHTL